MGRYISIDDKAYALDLTKLNEYLFVKKPQPREVDIVEVFNGDNVLQQKQITETKVTGNDSGGAEENIKYDTIKMLLSVLLNQDMIIEEIDLSTSIALNTLIKECILIEI